MKTFALFMFRTRIKMALAAGSLALLTAIEALAQPMMISTVAGSTGKGSVDGTGSSALFAGPQGVAVDAAGNVYVADTGNNVIRVVTVSGQSSTLAGSAGVTGSADGTGANASFNQPWGIALDRAGNIYVSDYGNSTIREITQAGVVTTLAGTAGVTGSVNATGTNALFLHPMGLAVDGANNIYVADYGNHLIRKITPQYSVSTLAGSAGVFGSTDGPNGLLYEPEAVAADASGNVYVADMGNAAVRMVTPAGIISTLAGQAGTLGSLDATGTNAFFTQPSGICVNSAGAIYVADYFNNSIRQISTNGVVTTLAGLAGTTGSADGTNGSARFWGPQGSAVDSNGTIYLADSANNVIRVITSAGAVTTLAGSASEGTINGAASSARFYSPRNVVVDGQNNIYVADTRNSVIRKITPSGIVSVLAGTPGVFGSVDGAGAVTLFAGPQGIAIDGSGNLYVADTGNSTVRKVASDGTTVTLAGSPGNPGNADGAGTSAQFNQPEGVAVDQSGNVFVADTGNHTIRRLTSAGVSSTLAGLAGIFGTIDGTNANARFNDPTGIVADSSGNLYVTDFNNHTIREVTTAGTVTTLAGWPGVWGNSDGSGTNALFFGPSGISMDGSGDLLVIDSGNNTLRKLTLSGGTWTSSTVAGIPGTPGDVDGTGTGAEFYYPAGVAVSAAGYVYVADAGNNSIRSQTIPPSIVVQPQSQTNSVGTSPLISVGVYGSSPLTYSWSYNGTNLTAANTSTFMATNAGNYQVVVSNPAGQATSDVATVTFTNNVQIGEPGIFQSISMLPNHTVQFALGGTSGATYTLQVSANLQSWSPLTTFTMTNGAVQWIDNTASNYPAQFYRLVSP